MLRIAHCNLYSLRCGVLLVDGIFQDLFHIFIDLGQFFFQHSHIHLPAFQVFFHILKSGIQFLLLFHFLIDQAV